MSITTFRLFVQTEQVADISLAIQTLLALCLTEVGYDLLRSSLTFGSKKRLHCAPEFLALKLAFPSCQVKYWVFELPHDMDSCSP